MRSLWPEEEELRGRDGQAWVEAFSVVPDHVQSAARRIVWWDFVSLHTMADAIRRGFGVFNRDVRDYGGSTPTNEEIIGGEDQRLQSPGLSVLSRHDDGRLERRPPARRALA